MKKKELKQRVIALEAEVAMLKLMLPSQPVVWYPPVYPITIPPDDRYVVTCNDSGVLAIN